MKLQQETESEAIQKMAQEIIQLLIDNEYTIGEAERLFVNLHSFLERRRFI